MLEVGPIFCYTL